MTDKSDYLLYFSITALLLMLLLILLALIFMPGQPDYQGMPYACTDLGGFWGGDGVLRMTADEYAAVCVENGDF